MARNIRLVVLDADGLLQNNDKKVEYFNRETYRFLKENGVRVDEEALAAVWKDIGRAASRGDITLAEARRRFFRAFSIPETLLEGYTRIDYQSLALIEPSEEGVAGKLGSLKAEGYLLAVLSNTAYDSKAKGAILERIGLGGLFDGIFVANEIKHRKPDREAYYAVLDRFGVAPKEAVFVGHRVEELEGAKAVGMHTISYKGYDGAEFVADDFGQIIEQVHRLG